MVVLVIAAVLVSAPLAATHPRTVRLGHGADTVWVMWPHGRPTSVVVFGHGWSTPFPVGFGPWVAHLRSRGSVVIYPRYRVGAGDSTSEALAAFETGVKTAFRRLGRVHVPVIALGKSFGGSAVFYYASSASSWGIPTPTAILSIFPAGPIGALPSAAISPEVFVEFFVGDADTTAGTAGANTFWSWLTSHPSSEKRYLTVRSRAGFVANHDSAQRSDRIARRLFWLPFDRIVARARTVFARTH